MAGIRAAAPPEAEVGKPGAHLRLAEETCVQGKTDRGETGRLRKVGKRVCASGLGGKRLRRALSLNPCLFPTLTAATCTQIDRPHTSPLRSSQPMNNLNAPPLECTWRRRPL